MLFDMIQIAVTKHAKEFCKHASAGQLQADLEIDQVRSSVLSNDDVFLFVQIEIGDPAFMKLGQNTFHIFEKIAPQVARK